MTQLVELANEYIAASNVVGDSAQLEYKAFIAGFKAARAMAARLSRTYNYVPASDIDKMGEEDAHD